MNPGWAFVGLIFSAILLNFFLPFKKSIFLYASFCSTIIFLFVFFRSVPGFCIYKEYEPIEVEKVYNDKIKIETIKTIEKRNRNIFTGKWGEYSSFEDKIINIRYIDKTTSIDTVEGR